MNQAENDIRWGRQTFSNAKSPCPCADEGRLWAEIYSHVPPSQKIYDIKMTHLRGFSALNLVIHKQKLSRWAAFHRFMGEVGLRWHALRLYGHLSAKQPLKYRRSQNAVVQNIRYP